MITSLKNATINDIAVTELLCYDQENIPALLSLCKKNSITYIPSKDRKSIYKMIEDGFVQETINDALCLSPDEHIFDEVTIKKFTKVDHNEIRFVLRDEKIYGVVHIVDYNSEYLLVELYRAFLRFENNLRSLLIKKDLKNEDFIKWVRVMSDCAIYEDDNTQNYWTKRYETLMPAEDGKRWRVENERRNLYAFQTFLFSDLLEYAIDCKLIDSSAFPSSILKKLRNYIAHARHLTSITEAEDGNLIYDFSHLQKFIADLKTFFFAFDHLAQLLDIDDKVNLASGNVSKSMHI